MEHFSDCAGYTFSGTLHPGYHHCCLQFWEGWVICQSHWFSRIFCDLLLCYIKNVILQYSYNILALFPGSPHVRTKMTESWAGNEASIFSWHALIFLQTRCCCMMKWMLTRCNASMRWRWLISSSMLWRRAPVVSWVHGWLPWTAPARTQVKVKEKRACSTTELLWRTFFLLSPSFPPLPSPLSTPLLPLSFLAADVIKKLELTYNRTRQAVITRELIEIISGAAAV